mgnify:CR=1 FL=1
MEIDIRYLMNETIRKVVVSPEKDELALLTNAGVYIMYHRQDCCENVLLEDVVGDFADIIGSPVIRVSVDTNQGDIPHPGSDSWTWTFYTIHTAKGHVTLRWLGESNGYYGESVDVRHERDMPAWAETKEE